MDTFDKIIRFLDDNKIRYQLSVHEPVLTSQQAADIRGVDIKTGVKAMIVRSKGKFYMFLLSAAKQLDLKKVKAVLDTDSVSLASRDEVLQVTGCIPGCVPPFPNLLGLESFADPSIEQGEVNFSVGKLTHSIKIEGKVLLGLIKPKQALIAKD